jgi:hypothetical protein
VTLLCVPLYSMSVVSPTARMGARAGTGCFPGTRVAQVSAALAEWARCVEKALLGAWELYETMGLFIGCAW